MKRREFITLLGGAAAWPLVARAQQQERMRRIRVLMGAIETNPESQARMVAFKEGLKALGWTDGRNVNIDYRLIFADLNLTLRYAPKLVGLTPNVILPTARLYCE